MLRLLTILISAIAFSVGTVSTSFAGDDAPKKETKKKTSNKGGKKKADAKKEG